MAVFDVEFRRAGAQQSPSPNSLEELAERLRGQLRRPKSVERTSRSLAETCRRIVSECDLSARRIVTEIATRREWSEELVRASLRELIRPFVREETLTNFARQDGARAQLIGFVMAGNIPGAGLHEVITALLAGCAVMIKPATSEPVFFAGFAEVLAQIDPELASRLVVLLWSRERVKLSIAMQRQCDRLLIFGNDETVARFVELSGGTFGAARPIGFGARVSGAVLAMEPRRSQEDLARAIALDVTLFEQCGCLSPHHIFVLDSTEGKIAQSFAAELASELEKLASGALPVPQRLSPESAAAIRHTREQARWRSLADKAVKLWEGPLPGWTVIYDRDASFQESPGYRTVFVSSFSDIIDLQRRFAPMKGRLEACAHFVDNSALQWADELRHVIEAAGASYVCAPGRMQSPPIDWPHGGGIFSRMIRGE